MPLADGSVDGTEIGTWPPALFAVRPPRIVSSTLGFDPLAALRALLRR